MARMRLVICTARGIGPLVEIMEVPLLNLTPTPGIPPSLRDILIAILRSSRNIFGPLIIFCSTSRRNWCRAALVVDIPSFGKVGGWWGG